MARTAGVTPQEQEMRRERDATNRVTVENNGKQPILSYCIVNLIPLI